MDEEQFCNYTHCDPSMIERFEGVIAKKLQKSVQKVLGSICII
jgi:hypothetical protein